MFIAAARAAADEVTPEQLKLEDALPAQSNMPDLDKATQPAALSCTLSVFAI
jgi:hypothetical protein